MPRSKSTANQVADILGGEVERIRKSAEAAGALSDEELTRLERITKINKILCVPMTAEERAELALTGDELVESLRPPRAAELFPRRGPKPTTNAHEVAIPGKP